MNPTGKTATPRSAPEQYLTSALRTLSLARLALQRQPQAPPRKRGNRGPRRRGDPAHEIGLALVNELAKKKREAEG
jgi:hypothetical protein